jgi:predicted nucleic acid-binding protein
VLATAKDGGLVAGASGRIAGRIRKQLVNAAKARSGIKSDTELLAARLAGIEPGREQALLNDATLYLQAIEQGQTVMTRNVREFDWFDQLLPSNRVLFYRQL